MDRELPGGLEACIDKFWSDNPELRRLVLRDWYARGYVSRKTDDAGRAAVDLWLAGARQPASQ